MKAEEKDANDLYGRKRNVPLQPANKESGKFIKGLKEGRKASWKIKKIKFAKQIKVSTFAAASGEREKREREAER